MRKRAEQHEYRRQQLLQIALDQFITKGFYGTSTREISRIAGISSGLMFNYFDSKESLFEALVEIGCEKLILETESESNPLGIFERHVGDLLQMLESNPSAAKMFVFMAYASSNATGISPKAAALLAGHDIIRQSVPLIKEGQKRGEIRHGDPHALSIAFWCSIQGIAEEIALNANSPIPLAGWIMDILRSKEE